MLRERSRRRSRRSSFLFREAGGALFLFDQRLPVGDGYLVIIGWISLKARKAVAVAAVFNEGRLERGLYAGDLGEVDIAPQCLRDADS